MFFCCSSAAVQLPVDVPMSLKIGTLDVAKSLSRQIANINLTLKSDSEIRVIRGLVKEANVLLSKTYQKKGNVPSYEKIGSLGGGQLRDLQVKMKRMQVRLLSEGGCKIMASSQEVRNLFDSMRELQRELNLLIGYFRDGSKLLKLDRRKEIEFAIGIFQKGIEEVTNHTKVVSEEIIRNLSETDVRKSLAFASDAKPKIVELIGEIIGISTIQASAPRPVVTSIVFTSLESIGTAAAPPVIHLTGMPFVRPRVNTDSEGGGPSPTENPPSPPLDGLGYVTTHHSIKVRRAPSDSHWDFDNEDNNDEISDLEKVAPASPSASQSRYLREHKDAASISDKKEGNEV